MDNPCVSSDTVVVDENVIVPLAQAEDPILMGCLNPVITLDGTASSSGVQLVYEWTTPDGNIASGGNTLEPAVDAPGTYSLMVLDTVNGCFSEVELTVVQDIETPMVDAGPGDELTCILTEITLQGAASGQVNRFEYQWTTLDGIIVNGAQTLTPLVSEAGTYTLTVIDTLNGCSTSDMVEITQDVNVPVADVAPSNALNCYFPTVTLDGTGSSQNPNLVYTWSTPNGNFASGTETLTPVIDMAGTYTLTINDTINSCITSQTIQVQADTVAPPLAIVEPEILNCYQPEISLLADAGSLPDITLVWTTTGGNFTGNETTLEPSVDQPGTYTLQVTNNANGCVESVETQVDSDFAEPLADAGPGGVINCADTVLTLAGNGDGGGAPLAFLWTTGDGSLTGGEDTPNPSVDAGGTYLLTLTNLENGCVSTADVLIDQDVAYPVANAGPQGLLNCYQPQIQLDGSASSSGGNFAYTWTTADGNILSGETGAMPAVDAPGAYALTVTNTVNHCVSADAVLVVEDFVDPLADAGPDGELTCSVTSIALSGDGSQGGNFTYSWTTSDGSIVSGANTLTPLIDAAGNYELEVFNVDNGCSTNDQATITTGVSYPDATVALAPSITCAIPDIQLNGIGSDEGPNFIYSWNTADGNILSGGNTLEPVVNMPGSYVLTVTNLDNDCVTTAIVDVPIDTLAPVAEAGASNLLTCAVLQLKLNGTGSSTGTNYSYDWTTADGSIQAGANTLAPTIDAPGTYQLLVSNQDNGCVSTDMVVVNQDIAPPAVAAATPGVLTCAVTSLNLSGNGSSTGANFNYTWTTSGGNILSGASTLSPLVNQPGTYNLMIFNTFNGCSSSAGVDVAQNTVAPTVDAGSAADLTCAVTSLSSVETPVGTAQTLPLVGRPPPEISFPAALH
ncbi:MAG: hypothetical protein IPJ40_04270 [Saprospirales bacterium]|nr:hypothetical protein [Saprospirales bacterium]